MPLSRMQSLITVPTGLSGRMLARDAFYSVNGQWTTLIGHDAGTQTFDPGIVSGGSGTHADSRSVYPGQGYWLHMAGSGTLCAVGM